MQDDGRESDSSLGASETLGMEAIRRAVQFLERQSYAEVAVRNTGTGATETDSQKQAGSSRQDSAHPAVPVITFRTPCPSRDFIETPVREVRETGEYVCGGCGQALITERVSIPFNQSAWRAYRETIT